MAKNTNVLPYTEVVERVKKLSRSGENTDEKIRGVIQDVYTREIPVKYDWNFLYASSSLTTTAEYKDGTVSATTGSATITMSSATPTSAMTGRKIKISGSDGV